MKFIKGSRRQSGCVLCSLLKEEDGPNNLILHRGQHAYIVLNKYPYNTGHMMVVPFAHTNDLLSLTPEPMLEMQMMMQECVRALTAQYHPQGFNIGLNVGTAGGAGIPDHLHYHVVPRWNGDTNFMPVIGQTKVLPETVEDTYHVLKKQLEA